MAATSIWLSFRRSLPRTPSPLCRGRVFFITLRMPLCRADRRTFGVAVSEFGASGVCLDCNVGGLAGFAANRIFHHGPFAMQLSDPPLGADIDPSTDRYLMDRLGGANVFTPAG